MPRSDYPKRRNTDCGLWFAWERTDPAACTKIWFRVRLAVSVAKSVSRIALCELDTFSKATQEAFMKEYRAKYPDRPVLQPRSDEIYAAPPRYSSADDHFRNFFDAVRTRHPVVEDAVFGLRAAGPALLANHSYFENRPIGWAAEKMTRIPIESHA